MLKKGLYNRKPARLKSWDYSNPHWYFTTICTDNHKNFLGEVQNGKTKLNDPGIFANKCLTEIPQHYKNVELDFYVIMPNHIHVIIILNSDVVGLIHDSTPRKNTLGNVIGSYKSAVTKWARGNGFNNFKWQRGFYDRIIRNEKELYQIRKYIEQNPLKWDLEKSLPENIDL